MHRLRHHQFAWCLLLLMLTVLVLACDRMLEGGAVIAIEIKEHNAEARKARVDLEPRLDSQRSDLENKALAVLNSDTSGDRPKVKEIFCGNPPDLSSLPGIYFKLEPGLSIDESASEECRAAINETWPGLESCYLVFENGSTGYVNCYADRKSRGVTCESSKRFIIKMLWQINKLKDECADIAEPG